MIAAPLDDDWLDIPWLPWHTLDPSAGDPDTLPTDPGVYRVWQPDYDEMVYIGETGRSLRGRVRALARGVYADQMPYWDLHTAAPCLWAIHQEHGPKFAVSVATPAGAETTQARKSIEAALIATHRRDVEVSPTANYARMIPATRSRRIAKTARIDDINDAGTAVLMVEQNAKEALRRADTGYVLVNGENAYTAPGDKLLEDEEVRKRFLGG